MKVDHKIGSLLRRKQSFFAITYDWETKGLEVVPNYEDYLERLEYLESIGMCKRNEWVGKRAL